MSPAQILQLVIALGPAAFDLIEQLIAVWSKPELTLDEVKAILEKTKRSYEDYMK
jgi:hypothetical protein